MARRLHQTLADYVVLAISPALIMTLVGSLVFFLLAVFYQGEFELRLHWVMACFVFAAVLIGRISIEEGFERAAPFGIALAIVVGLATMKFVELHGTWIDQFGWLINWGLIGLIWWCAHRLTWDCTLIDDAQDASGEGLLQTAGLEGAADAEAKKSDRLAEMGLEGTTSRGKRPSWWQRYVERQRRPHAPGVWVVYFSLAALPLFGIGQWFIPATNFGARRYAFWLLCVYVASGMGLLLTTSFLALRRYLRQRRIEMPTLMANLWLGTGAAIVLLLLVLAALLPRPSAEYAISELPFTVGSPEQHGSRAAPVPREGTQGDQQGPAADNHPEEHSGEEQAKGDAPPPSEPPEKSSSSAQNEGAKSQNPQSPPAGSSSQSGQSNAAGSQSSQSGPASNDQNKSEGKSNQSSSQNNSQSPNEQSQKGEQSQSPKADAKSPEGKQSQRDSQQQPREQSPQSPRSADEAQRPDASKPDAQEQQPQSSPNASTPPPSPIIDLTAAAWPLSDLLKWAFYAAFALFVLYALWRSRRELLGALREILAMLGGLFGGLFTSKRARSGVESLAGATLELPPAPFASFADPFATGIAERYATPELVRYSFEAFEAWSREHGCQRSSDQTPHELARAVSKLDGRIADDAKNLAEMYARVAYARGDLPATCREQLGRLWRTMRTA